MALALLCLCRRLLLHRLRARHYLVLFAPTLSRTLDLPFFARSRCGAVQTRLPLRRALGVARMNAHIFTGAHLFAAARRAQHRAWRGALRARRVSARGDIRLWAQTGLALRQLLV